MTIKRAAAAVVFAIAVGMLATGCGGTPAAPPAAPSASPSPTPAAIDLLTAAADKLRATTASFTADMTGEFAITGAGRFDGVSGDATSTTTVAVDGRKNSLELTRIRGDLWIKTTGSGAWLHTDVDKVDPAGSLHRSLADPTGADKLLRAAVDVGRSADGVLLGKLDMTTSPLLPSGLPAAAAAAAKQVSFQARLDAEGRLTQLAIDLRYVLRSPRDGSGVLVIEFTDFGKPLGLTPPTGKIVEADKGALARL
ncbi:hypothetical protein [Catellatospora vulcania]|uniref:hypothetical protein n=1 Tax=Catellatospora vulcania TaxID=1460450 RepID=UPI0012D3ABC7|nr:hypothetical protein [Catellatospora vulcania]